MTEGVCSVGERILHFEKDGGEARGTVRCICTLERGEYTAMATISLIFQSTHGLQMLGLSVVTGTS